MARRSPIAGLMNNTVTSQLSKIPGIGDIPILGLLFRSKAARKDQTELVVMITPTILRRNSTGVSSTVPDMAEPMLPPAAEDAASAATVEPRLEVAAVDGAGAGSCRPERPRRRRRTWRSRRTPWPGTCRAATVPRRATRRSPPDRSRSERRSRR